MRFETNVTSFEIARPVTHGLQTLLPMARLVGRRIMDDLSWAVVLPEMKKDSGAVDDEFPDNLAGVPRFRVYSKMRLPFLRYAGDRRTTPPAPDFHRLASFLGSQSQSASRRVRDIPEKMSHIALEYDGTTTIDRAVARCSGFAIEAAYAKEGYELLLNVAEPARFYREAGVYNDAIKRIRAMKPFLKQQGEEDGLAIPIAWIAEDMTQNEKESLLSDLKTYSLKQYKLQLGPVLPPHVQ